MCKIERRWSLHRGDFDAAGRARADFREFLRPLGTTDSDLDGAEIIFGELLTNALRHSGSAAVARLTCDSARRFVLEIRDTGPGFTLESGVASANADAEGGRGLLIAQKLGAGLSVSADHGSCVVEAHLPVLCNAC